MTNFDLNGTIGPLLDGVAALAPSILNLIIQYVPLTILGIVITFLVGIFKGWIKI